MNGGFFKIKNQLNACMDLTDWILKAFIQEAKLNATILALVLAMQSSLVKIVDKTREGSFPTIYQVNLFARTNV